MALEMSQEFLTVSLDITNKVSPRLSLAEKFARIAVYKLSIIPLTPKAALAQCLQSSTPQTTSFFIFTDRNIRLTA